jgi:hypothetical protein
MRILVVTNLFSPEFLGGYELSCAQMVETLRTKGHSVRVVTSVSAQDDATSDGDLASPRPAAHLRCRAGQRDASGGACALLSRCLEGQPRQRSRTDRKPRRVRARCHKGSDIMIDMAAKLHDLGYANSSIDIYSHDRDPRFRQMLHAREVVDNVRFMGSLSQPELLSRYPSYEVFAFPTWAREPFAFHLDTVAPRAETILQNAASKRPIPRGSAADFHKLVWFAGGLLPALLAEAQ